ncbi:MAG: GntR family transcriptional regulator, partial [Achromobacter xylosoxidans]|nr:GntR family transcriptional regulator [Achromobacter xylosoxidans]
MAPANAEDLPALDRSGDVPLHAQVAALLRGYIRTRKLGAGALLPSEAALCERFGVARSVVRQALSALAAEGLIQR